MDKLFIVAIINCYVCISILIPGGLYGDKRSMGKRKAGETMFSCLYMDIINAKL